MLPQVSRTFALGIKLLPARLELPVRLGYLLCRIADTVEDDLALSPGRKAELLDEFLIGFDDPDRADAFGDVVSELTSASEDYVDLVSANGEVFTLYRNLDVRTQAILRRWIEEMVRGMRRFVVEHPAGIRIASVPEFHQYCYYVAGTVGHLLTELWHHHSSAVDKRVYAEVAGRLRTVRRSAAVGEHPQGHRLGCRTRELDLRAGRRCWPPTAARTRRCCKRITARPTAPRWAR